MCSAMAHVQLGFSRLQTPASPCSHSPQMPAASHLVPAPRASCSLSTRRQMASRAVHHIGPVAGRDSSCCWGSVAIRTAGVQRMAQSGIMTAVQRTRRQFMGSWEGQGHLGGGERSQLRLAALPRREGRARPSRGVAVASLLGVGAPEALVIGVVALLVFGPKGLAEVARNLGKTLRTFQPTIKELQQVSQEFRSTLEQEIGLDDLKQQPYRPPPTPPPPAATSPLPAASPAAASASPTTEGFTKEEAAKSAAQGATAYTSEDYLRITEEQAKALVSEEARKAAEAAAWGGSPPVQKANVDVGPSPVPVAETTSASAPAPAPKTPHEAPKQGTSSGNQ